MINFFQGPLTNLRIILDGTRGLHGIIKCEDYTIVYLEVDRYWIPYKRESPGCVSNALADFDKIVIGKTTLNEAYDIVTPRVRLTTSYGYMCEYNTIEGAVIKIRFGGEDMKALTIDAYPPE